MKSRKNLKSLDYIGCSWECLAIYLEKMFKTGMTWDNYGKWHVDHVRPISSAKSLEALIPLLHYSNLQPLWAEENLSKWAHV